MDLRMRNRLGVRWSQCGMMVALLFTAGAAAAGRLAEPPKGDEPVLKGPPVKERAVPGVVNTFGQSQEARRMAERIPPEVLREALSVLTREDTPEAIRASEELEAEFRAVGDELRTATRKYMAEHREELIELRKDANLSGRAAQELDRALGRRGGQSPDATAPRGGRRPDTMEPDQPTPPMDEAAEARQEAARQRLRELMSGAPRVEDYMTRIWEKLSPAQREAVDAKLDEYRKQEARRREEMYVRQRVGQRTSEGPGATPQKSENDMMSRENAARSEQDRPGQPMRPNVAAAQRRERLMRLFDTLSPEQQEMLLERLENAARDGVPGPSGRRAARGPREADKPAPGMDEVDVPKPEDVEQDTPPRPPATPPKPRKRPNPS